MDAAGAAHDALLAAKAWVFPISAVAPFVAYPIVLLVWTIMEGGAAAEQATRRSASTFQAAEALDDAAKRPSKRPRTALLSGLSNMSSLARMSGFVLLAGGSLSFIRVARGESQLRGQRRGGEAPAPVQLGGEASGALSGAVEIGRSPASCLAISLASSAVVLAGVVGAAIRREARRRPGERRGVLVRCGPADGSAPQAVSPWHHVDLRVKDWLDKADGTYRFVNEIPQGTRRKFEVQTELPGNVIREDPKASRWLRAFAEPVPFNYGCFPQTFRDPLEADDIHGAPGDNDPLDVIDLAPEPARVGEIVICRPLGAVCLIDEEKADWKIIVVNTRAKGPLAAARSVEEVERVSPGCVEKVLRWMDDFKRHSSAGEARLHFRVHGAETAASIIERDHAAWLRLVEEADASGTARGHWIRPGQDRHGAGRKVAVLPHLPERGRMSSRARCPSTSESSCSSGSGSSRSSSLERP